MLRVQAQNSVPLPITVTVTSEKRTTYGAMIPKTNIQPETRTEKLKITLQNLTHENYSDLIVRCCLFAKDVRTEAISVVAQQETPISLPAATTLVITSNFASITYTPQHDIGHKQRPVKKGEPEESFDKVVKAVGQEFVGHGIEVRQTNLAGGQFFGPLHSKNIVIGQLFSSLNLTSQFQAAFTGAKKS